MVVFHWPQQWGNGAGFNWPSKRRTQSHSHDLERLFCSVLAWSLLILGTLNLQPDLSFSFWPSVPMNNEAITLVFMVDWFPCSMCSIVFGSCVSQFLSCSLSQDLLQNDACLVKLATGFVGQMVPMHPTNIPSSSTVCFQWLGCSTEPASPPWIQGTSVEDAVVHILAVTNHRLDMSTHSQPAASAGIPTTTQGLSIVIQMVPSFVIGANCTDEIHASWPSSQIMVFIMSPLSFQVHSLTLTLCLWLGTTHLHLFVGAEIWFDFPCMHCIMECWSTHFRCSRSSCFSTVSATCSAWWCTMSTLSLHIPWLSLTQMHIPLKGNALVFCALVFEAFL